jgi:hypothetical protein
MRLPFRSLPLLCSLAALSAGLRADEVQVLPSLTVNAPRLPYSGQPTLLQHPDYAYNAIDLDELARAAAGLSINDAGARGFGTTTSLRGLANTPFFGDPSVTVYLDGIPFPASFILPARIPELSDTFVSRGPQAGLFYGHAGDAGVIDITTPRPAEQREGLGFSLGNHGARSAGAYAQYPDQAGRADFTVSLDASQRDGYIRNTTLNRTVDDRRALSGLLLAHYRPSALTEITVHAVGERSRDGAQALVPLGGPLYTVARGKEGESDIDFGALSVGVRHRLPEGLLTAATTYSDWKLSPYSNRLVVFGGKNFDSALTQTQRTLAEEVRFQGTEYSGGLYYADGRTRGATDRVFSGFPIERSSYDIRSRTAVWFGRRTFQAGDAWVLTAGLRAERTAKDFTRVETIPGSFTMQRDNQWTAVLPALSASRTIDPSSSVTFTAAGGFKPGGYSGYTGRADLAEFGPQRNWGLEAAYHHGHHDGPARPGTGHYLVRAYAMRVTGYQIERSFAVPNTQADEYLVVNAAEATVFGAELESGWWLAERLRLSLIGSVCRATLEKFRDPFTGADYSGKRAPYAPSGNARLRLDYLRGPHGFFAGAGVSWTGTTYYDEQETARFAQRSYALIEADLGWKLPHGQLRFYGRNLGDKGYYSAITPGVGHATPGAPLTWGGELTLRW